MGQPWTVQLSRKLPRPTLRPSTELMRRVCYRRLISKQSTQDLERPLRQCPRAKLWTSTTRWAKSLDHPLFPTTCTRLSILRMPGGIYSTFRVQGCGQGSALRGFFNVQVLRFLNGVWDVKSKDVKPKVCIQ